MLALDRELYLEISGLENSVRTTSFYFNKDQTKERCRIVVDASRDLSTQKNSSNIKVYNLSYPQIAEIIDVCKRKPKAIVTSKYGTTDGSIELKTDIAYVDSYREGNDVILDLSCGEGLSALTNPVLKFNLVPGGNPFEAIIDEIIKVFDDDGINTSELKALIGKTVSGLPSAISSVFSGETIKNGLTLSADMNKLLKMAKGYFGINISIQNDAAVVSGIPQNIELNSIDQLSIPILQMGVGKDLLNSGLLTRPQPTENDGYYFECLPLPGITPGKYAYLLYPDRYKNENYELYRIFKCSYSLDNDADGPWQVDCNSTKLPGLGVFDGVNAEAYVGNPSGGTIVYSDGATVITT